MFGIAGDMPNTIRKVLLSLLYLNMEVWRLPSNHDQAKDAWTNTDYAQQGIFWGCGLAALPVVYLQAKPDLCI